MELELQKGSRSRFLATIIFLLMAAFIIRLFFLQVIEHDHYVSLAKKEQIKRLTIPAKRGQIYAMDGSGVYTPLVMNQTVYTVFADPQMINDHQAIIDVIARVAGGNARSGIPELLKKTESRYQILATKITRKQADLIKEADLSGIGFQAESVRAYPEGSLAAQTLGFLDYDGNARYGVEQSLDERLTGQDGLLQSVTDVRDVPLTIGGDYINTPAVDGQDIVLTIDRNIQSKAEQALREGMERTGAAEASMIVMDPQNGQILAMADMPGYDPSRYFEVKDAALFNNHNISLPYEPGSTIKLFTAATAIDKGVMSPSDTYINTDFIRVEDRVITNASKGQLGEISFQHALNWSLNTGFVTVAQKLGDGKTITSEARNTMYDYFSNRFGFGKRTGIEVAGENSGLLVSPETAEGNAVRYSNMSFGQGMDTTMIQVTSAFCSLVNGGKYYQPNVVAGVLGADGKLISEAVATPKQIISEQTAATVKNMTYDARQAFTSGYGADKPGYYIGGKTGTSQVVRDGVYADDESVGSYLGFGGNDTTRYVIMVRVAGERMELKGANHAMPIFADMSNWMIDYLRIQPKG
jgi:cell division protein FtsI/penicillin-binding protein 2